MDKLLGSRIAGGNTAYQCIMEDYDLSRILAAHPELKHCRVASYEDYYGIQIFRVRSQK